MNSYKYIVSKINYYRLLNNLTQRELAERCGYSFEYIRKILSPKYINDNNKNITLQVVYDIAQALNVDVELLLTSNVKNEKRYSTTINKVNTINNIKKSIGIYERVAINLRYYINNFGNDKEEKELFPNVKAIKLISSMTNITEKRLKNIMTLKGYPRIEELTKISNAIGVPIQKLVDD